MEVVSVDLELRRATVTVADRGLTVTTAVYQLLKPRRYWEVPLAWSRLV